MKIKDDKDRFDQQKSRESIWRVWKLGSFAISKLLSSILTRLTFWDVSIYKFLRRSLDFQLAHRSLSNAIVFILHCILRKVPSILWHEHLSQRVEFSKFSSRRGMDESTQRFYERWIRFSTEWEKRIQSQRTNEVGKGWVILELTLADLEEQTSPATFQNTVPSIPIVPHEHRLLWFLRSWSLQSRACPFRSKLQSLVWLSLPSPPVRDRKEN